MPLYCEACGEQFDVDKDDPPQADTKPKRLVKCRCGSIVFTTRLDFDKALSANDKRFLKSIRIASI